MTDRPPSSTDIKCGYCKYPIVVEDDYGGLRVWDSGTDYHWICWEEMRRESVERFLLKMENK